MKSQMKLAHRKEYRHNSLKCLQSFMVVEKSTAVAIRVRDTSDQGVKLNHVEVI